VLDVTRYRIRTIKPEAWQDERVGDLSHGARLLWLGLITMADDQGRLRELPTAIAGHVFPYDDISSAKLQRWLKEVTGSGMVVRYESGGKRYIAFPTWSEHQRIDRPSDSELPAPPQFVDCSSNRSTNEDPRNPESIDDRSIPPRRRAVRSVPIPSVLAVEETETTQGFSSSADDELPTGFPVELTPHLNAAEAVLADLAARQGSKAVTRMSLASVIAGRPRKPLVKSARDFASWADGKAQKRRDVVSGYRNWLDRTDDLAATERFGVDAGVPSTGDTYEQRRALRAAAASRVLAERSAQ
jgi:hypothetical protein